MALDDTIAILSSHPMFDALPEEAVRVLAFSSDYLELPQGARLYAQGAPADAGFILVSGQLELETVNNGVATSAGMVPEGALLGELALLCQTSRSTNAVARSHISLLKIPRTSFRRVLEGYPQGAAELLRRVRARLQLFTNELDGVREAYLAPHISAGDAS